MFIFCYDYKSEIEPWQLRSNSHKQSVHRRMSFSEQDDVLPPVSLLSHQRSFIYDDIIGLTSGGKQEISLFSEEEGIADMDMPDHLFIDELEFLDNITSCDKVENCVMLSEYEQNLIKETAQSPMQSRRRLWPFGRPSSSNLHNNLAASEVPMMKIGVGGFRQSREGDSTVFMK